MYCFVILLLFNEMQMSVRRFSAIPHLRVENPMEFLAFLQERRKIRPGDVTYLVSLLKKIGNVQLANTVMKELGKMALYHRNFHSVNITKKLRQTLGIT